MLIQELFSAAQGIARPIEKVITYKATQEKRLKNEITEYVVTESIEERFERLLTNMQLALETGGNNEIGVWVSGFYGSGKSSFTKYLGLALDEGVTIEGKPFLHYLQNCFTRATTKAQLTALAHKYPAAVVLLDLASEMPEGAATEAVSTVLYYKVLRWAGYSRNLKVAALERRLRQDGRFDELNARIQRDLQTTWQEVQNDPLVIDSLVPELAHELYPQIFKTPNAFTTEEAQSVRMENERVAEMLDIIREHSGKEFVIFIVDEVGQYVGAQPSLILNLDGLAKNLKELGQGKVWIIGTAQQTLTEDDPRAALNSPELFKLKDRFPLRIDLESSDIKEICARRLLDKSPAGRRELEGLFDSCGQALRHNTKLQDAEFYNSDFDKNSFVNLYPFLPAHFDILLHLLSSLSRSTGGIGLRSAIKVIQDILVDDAEGRQPVAAKEVGRLATTVTLYDALEKDIQLAFPSLHRAVGKTAIRFPHSPIHLETAKTVAVLQILGNMPVTPQNVAALMHTGLGDASRREAVDAAVADLINDAQTPFGERDGGLCFFSEKLNDIEQERAGLPLRATETRRIFNETLREVFNPLPKAQLHGSLVVSSGLKTAGGSLGGERDAIQTVVEFVAPEGYEAARIRLVEESRRRDAQSDIFLLARTVPEIDDKCAEIYRCRIIGARHLNDPDAEVKAYCAGQNDRAGRLSAELVRLLGQCLAQGSFVFRGQVNAVSGFDADPAKAAQKCLADAAVQVFDHYEEAPVRVGTALAENFLRKGNLKAIDSGVDPLGLVRLVGGTPRIDTEHRAITSIRDHIERQGTVEGRRLLEHFGGAPYGWSPDTLRYLAAAMLLAGELKLKVSGQETTTNGQLAIDALRTNQAFKTVGLSLRDERLGNDVLARAARRLGELVGDAVAPDEGEISQIAAKHFPEFQRQCAPLAEKLDALRLPGGEDIRSLCRELADLLAGDASDAPRHLGGEESVLYDTLKWATEVDRALTGGLEQTVRQLREHQAGIAGLPNMEIPGKLRSAVAEDLERVEARLGDRAFYACAAELQTALNEIQLRTHEAAAEMAQAPAAIIRQAAEEFRQSPDWAELGRDEQSEVLAGLEGFACESAEDLSGIRTMLVKEYELRSTIDDLRARIKKTAEERRAARMEEERRNAAASGQKKLTRTLRLPAALHSAAELDELIRSLQALKAELALYPETSVTLTLES